MNNLSKIIVAIRKRPLSKKEASRGEKDIVEIAEPTSNVIIKEPRQKVDLTKFIEEHNFMFDSTISEKTSNQDLYIKLLQPMIKAVFQGVKVTCFAYGQTGSGKTHTMLGNDKVPGLYLLAANDLFANLPKHYNVSVSFYEIYCEKLYDLLNQKAQLNAREDAKGTVNIVGLSEKVIENVNDLMDVIDEGHQNRVVAQNSANADSSRSHAILQITLIKDDKLEGKLSFIDLAGSERGADVTDSNKQTRIDGAQINQSLLALKECIRALDQNKNHTPFRGSKLTQVLKDSFIGNCRTLMIGTISPSNLNAEHTLNTLRYADRVKELKKSEQGISGNYNGDELFLARQQQQSVKVAGQKKFEHQLPPTKLFDDDLEGLSQRHENLISVILEEEESIIQSHRSHIDEIVEIVKTEMKLLGQVDQPGSEVNEYVNQLDMVLAKKMQKISDLRKKLEKFKGHLKEEQGLCQRFDELKNQKY